MTRAIILSYDKSYKLIKYAGCSEVAKSNVQGSCHIPSSQEKEEDLSSSPEHSFDGLLSPSFQGAVSFSNTELTNCVKATDFPKQSICHLNYQTPDSKVSVR